MQKFDASKDYYSILGVSEDASKEEVDRAFRNEARTRHPDGGGSEEAMKSLNEAHDILSDPDTRKAYDAERKPPRIAYSSSAVFDPDAASRAGTLGIAVKDVDLSGLLLGAATAFGVGIPLLLLVEMQWVFFLWPLRIMSLGALLLGVLMAHSALRVKHRNMRKANPDGSRKLFVMHEIIFWLTAIAVIGSLVLALYVL
ncbi:MAG TPA: DnaJ domain-containing protein [Blastocatellia bacterium]|nr:DnaJ domain-containing protein [Blastocatellia bacterium]